MGNKLPGLILSTTIGLAAFFAASIPNYSLKISGVLIGLIVGVLIANLIKMPKVYESGIQFSAKKILEYAIILLGFGISFQSVGNLGWQSLAILITMILAVLLFTLFASKLFKGKRTTNLLVGFGTTICGSSAIAAVAENVTKDKEDIGISIAVVNLLGLLFMIAFPFILQQIVASDIFIATIIGGTLHAVGNVAGAGFAMGDEIGNLALTIKLGRVALLAPAIIFFNVMLNKNSSIKQHLKLPYYIWGFIAASVIVSFFNLPEELLSFLKTLGKILLTIAMVGIGLNISLKNLMKNGRDALGFGLAIFIFQLLFVVGMLYIIY